MKLEDINAEITFDIWVKPEFENEKIELGIGKIKPSDYKNQYNLIINKKLHRITLNDSSISIDLNFHLKRGYAHLVEVVQISNDGTALLKVIFFNGDIVEMGNIEVGIDERIVETVKKNSVYSKSTEQIGVYLSEKCMIRVGSEMFFLMMSGRSADADFETKDSMELDDLEEHIPSKQYREFSLYGERMRIPVEKRHVDKSKEIFFATKIIFKDSQKKEGALRLARGEVNFSDYTKIGSIRALAAGAMSQLTLDAGSYLKKWDEYGAIEGEMLLERAKSVGRINYHGAEQANGCVKFFVESVPLGYLSVGDELEITLEEPIYIKNRDINWKKYCEIFEDGIKEEKNVKEDKNDESIESIFAPIKALSETTIELDLPSIPNEEMFFILSINGDKIQIERRMKARTAIMTGNSANPLLGLLIEEGGELPNIQRVTKIKPLTSFVRNKIFQHPPTDRQIEAIDIALNTPDIAMIQGPPGTGKTTVITAILERLNQEYDKTQSIRGQILVSGFQHDAVENIVSRLSINSLPAVKFGKRSTDSEFDEDAVTHKMNKWCKNVAEKIREKNPQIYQSEHRRKLFELFLIYSKSPSQSNTKNLANGILDLPRDSIVQECIDEANDILETIKKETTPLDLIKIRLIRSLRVSEMGFLDDGSENAMSLFNEIEDELNDDELKLLEYAARWQQGNNLDFIDNLKELKENLLLRYMPRPEFRIEKNREDVLRLVVKVSAQLESSLKFEDKRDSILAEFLHELDDNPDGVRESIEDYNFIFAATTQQSEGKAIRRAKKKFNDNELVKYDTVIVDEAARTSPRDLLIPMSQAEKRIILVGDHRQLPHLIDEEVARVLEEGDSSESVGNDSFVKKSMFEYLFRRLKKLEEKDNIKRTVTLDAQYRTHPLLGSFSSDNFYKKYGESYLSPLPDTFFNQTLKGINGSPAVWIDVPNQQGDEGKTGYSRKRTVEAQKISEYLSRWIKSEAGKKLSFGIISFYKAQSFEAYRELEKFGITEKASDGSWQIAQKYSLLENGEERLRIGTVDAFQGMEFDVVFLSIVRTQELERLNSWINKEQDYEKVKRGVFGHLMSENRLCVSMSRQKKVLAIVGDSELIRAKIAIDSVPALSNYYYLCKEQGVIL